MAKRLWEKGEKLEHAVLDFTVGCDNELDEVLTRWDVIGSAAHARMLEKIGILSDSELEKTLEALKQILEVSDRGQFEIPVELEDCHTAIENALSEALGEVGQKIHTGRSRNDQVITAVRLYLRAEVVDVLDALGSFCDTLLGRFDEVGDVPMPGYTHMRRAMPSSVGMWLEAFVEHSLELMSDGLRLLDAIDSNPLGTAAGFGVPLDLDRAHTAELLGFSRVQRNPIDVQNSRGRYELKVVRWAADIAGMFEKLSWDMILYSMPEFGFMSLPVNLTTGSSIMPQKRNPDVLELLRAKASRVRTAGEELQGVISKLPSNFHRDFQVSKEPFLRALGDVHEMLRITSLVMERFRVEEENCRQAMSADLFVTYDVYRRVREGTAFRAAYRQTAEAVNSGAVLDREELAKDFSIVKDKLDKSAAEARLELEYLEEEVQSWAKKIEAVEDSIFSTEKKIETKSGKKKEKK